MKPEDFSSGFLFENLRKFKYNINTQEKKHDKQRRLYFTINQVLKQRL